MCEINFDKHNIYTENLNIFFSSVTTKLNLKQELKEEKCLPFQARNKTVLYEQSPKATNYDTKGHQKNTQIKYFF